MKLPRVLCLLFVIPSAWANESNPYLAIKVEHPILILSANPALPTSTQLTVTPLNFPPSARLTCDWHQVQDVLSPIAAQMETKPIKFSSTSTGTTNASFPDWGVYEIQVTVTNTANNQSASQNTWVNVWDCHSHIIVNEKPDPLCVAPGVNPPPVRTLSPDPGPFSHPRLYCTDADWEDINSRCTQGFIPGNGYKHLQDDLAKGLDSASSDNGKLMVALEAYADAVFKGSEPDLTMGIPSEQKEGKPNWENAWNHLRGFSGQLRDASFAEWVKIDPKTAHGDVPQEDQDRFKKLAKVLTALCHELLTKSWDEKTGEFHKDYPMFIPGLDQIGDGMQEFQQIALAYDFLYPWMDEQQQRETRNFLFAVSVGRVTGARWFVPRVNGQVINHGVERGSQQNGDFMNISEERVLSQLVIDGEESAVDPQIVQTFTTTAKPADYLTSGNIYPYDWMQYVDNDNGRDNPASKPYPAGGNWPHARKVEVDNLQRMLWWNDDWYVSPWGFMLNREGYYGFSAYGVWPVSVAYARHGSFNMFVGSSFYRTALHLLYELNPGEATQKSPHNSSNIYLYDHHDGGADSRQAHVLIMKYMYPEDPGVDYIYESNAPYFESSPQFPFEIALFGMDTGIHGQPTTMPEMAQAKALPLTKVDPQEGVVVARSGWNESDMELYFDCGWPHTGHMHAEKNSFTFFALGRAWAISPGYHVVSNSLQSTIMVQDPAYANDPLTHGYIGESPCDLPKGSPYPSCFPTPPGHLMEVEDSPDKLSTLMVGDAKAAYNFCYSNDPKTEITPPWVRADFMYPGLLPDLLSRLPDPMNKSFFTDHVINVGWPDKIHTGFNAVKYAYRSIVFVRGAHPYVLFVDDFRKDDTPRNYRWSMNCCWNFGPPDGKFANEQGNSVDTSLMIGPDATPTQATLLHLPDQGTADGLPRLLVEDLSETDNHAQPPIAVVHQLQNGDIEESNRLFIDRNNVLEPNYKILFYPYRTGETLPETHWNTAHTQLQIHLPDGALDTFTFQRDETDHRTRIQFFRKR